jgi:hypothetical protein
MKILSVGFRSVGINAVNYLVVELNTVIVPDCPVILTSLLDKV